METQTVWITLNTESKAKADGYLAKSTFYEYWTYTIGELFVYDSQYYRLPTLQIN